MPEPLQLQYLMVGLPETGKTTFLAAFWHVVKSEEVPGSLRLVRLDGDQEYLNRIADQWSKCQRLDRTLLGSEVETTMLLRNPSDDLVARLTIPDMSGESFAVQWEGRRCPLTYAQLVYQTSGCLLFVHPEKVKETELIADANATYAAWDSNCPAEQQDQAASGSPWEARHAPTQVQMVELLQFLSELAAHPLRVAVVVSAWDVVVESDSPSDWVQKRLPLLWQFLEVNPSQFACRFFGVSAQGGRTEEADRLLDHATASRRIIVRGPGVAEHDITSPVRWLMSATD
jgi:hypothetical protein